MKILIFGASGYAGKCIKKTLENKFNNIYGTYRTSIDLYLNDNSMHQYVLGDEKQLLKILEKINPDVIITCFTGEFLKQMEAYIRIGKFLVEKNGKIIFLSSSNVFDGALEKTHFEADKPIAVSDYGKFKIECEILLKNLLGDNAIIVRIPEIWGRDCPRILKLTSDAKNGNQISSYGNIFVNYTTNKQIAEWISYMIEYELNGIFHIGTTDIYEYFQFQKELIQSLHLEEPSFSIKYEEEKKFQAVLPSRKEIPESMQICVKDIIGFLTNEIN